MDISGVIFLCLNISDNLKEYENHDTKKLKEVISSKLFNSRNPF